MIHKLIKMVTSELRRLKFSSPLPHYAAGYLRPVLRPLWTSLSEILETRLVDNCKKVIKSRQYQSKS